MGDKRKLIAAIIGAITAYIQMEPKTTANRWQISRPQELMRAKRLNANNKVSDEVKADDVILILEAMKMANTITTPLGGRVKAINFASGDKVARDDVLALIG